MSECAKFRFDNGSAEPKDVEIGIFRPQRRLVRATVIHARPFLQCAGQARQPLRYRGIF